MGAKRKVGLHAHKPLNKHFSTFLHLTTSSLIPHNYLEYNSILQLYTVDQQSPRTALQPEVCPPNVVTSTDECCSVQLNTTLGTQNVHPSTPAAANTNTPSSVNINTHKNRQPVTVQVISTVPSSLPANRQVSRYIQVVTCTSVQAIAYNIQMLTPCPLLRFQSTHMSGQPTTTSTPQHQVHLDNTPTYISMGGLTRMTSCTYNRG